MGGDADTSAGCGAASDCAEAVAGRDPTAAMSWIGEQALLGLTAKKVAFVCRGATMSGKKERAERKQPRSKSNKLVWILLLHQ